MPVAADDPLLCGSLATLAHNCVWYNEDVESWFALYCQAHEYAHYWLHHGQTHCSRADIKLTRAIYRRMVFATQPQHVATQPYCAAVPLTA